MGCASSQTGEDKVADKRVVEARNALSNLSTEVEADRKSTTTKKRNATTKKMKWVRKRVPKKPAPDTTGAPAPENSMAESGSGHRRKSLSLRSSSLSRPELASYADAEVPGDGVTDWNVSGVPVMSDTKSGLALSDNSDLAGSDSVASPAELPAENPLDAPDTLSFSTLLQ